MSRGYCIPLSGLREGHHIFEFEISRSFFDKFDESEIREGELAVVTELEKASSHIDLDVRISGRVKIGCDRCLDMFYQKLDCNNRLLVKFGAKLDDSDPEILTVPRDQNELDLSQIFYEFIYLALPIQRVHPDDENGKSLCNPVMLEKLKEHLVEAENRRDPRWDDLKKLIKNN